MRSSLGPITFVAILLVATATGGADAPTPKPQDFRGKVQPLSAVLDKYGVKMDADAAAQSMALVGDDGKIYPLIKDDATRMFFKDTAILNRPMQLRARLLDGNSLHVLEVHSIVKGDLCEIYYWCDVCSIRRRVGKE